MAFLGGLCGIGKAAALPALLNPVVLIGAAVVVGVGAVVVLAAGENRPPGRILIASKKGDIDSSEVEDRFILGEVDTYGNMIRNNRDFTKGKDGDKYCVEADHIPPLDSLRRAETEYEDNFRNLYNINPGLYNMVISLRNDPLGRNLLTVQVCREHHRNALSSGSSRESKAVRGLLAFLISIGEAKVMLKMAMIIAHPFVSQQIREEAGLRSVYMERRIPISDNRTLAIYRRAFMEVIRYYYEKGIINVRELIELEEYVENEVYSDPSSSEYQEILETVRRATEQ